jgi:hypothetical protein
MSDSMKFLFYATISELKKKRELLLDADFYDAQDYREIQAAVERIDKELSLRRVWSE